MSEHRIPAYYVGIEKRIEALTLKRQECLEIAKAEREYQGIDFMMHGDLPYYVPVEDLASRYEKWAIELTKAIEDLKPQLPCREFIQRFGFWLHEEYRERYPINAATRFMVAPYNGGSVYYVVYKPEQITAFSVDMPLPTTPNIEQREARWERWRDRSDAAPIVALAYNDVENIVYIGE